MKWGNQGLFPAMGSAPQGWNTTSVIVRSLSSQKSEMNLVRCQVPGLVLVVVRVVEAEVGVGVEERRLLVGSSPPCPYPHP